MNSIRNSLSSFLTLLCSTLLSLLGFGCSSSPEDRPDMYGMPVGNFEIKGSVTDEEGKPVEDAEIRVTHSDAPSGIYTLESTHTDAEGKYNVPAVRILDDAKVVCIPIQSNLEPDSVIVSPEFDHKGNGAWDLGHAEETVNFILKSKKE